MTGPRTGGAAAPIIAVAAGVLALIGLTTALVLLTGADRPAELDPNSPEGRLQSYLESFERGDHEAAYGHFSRRVRDELSLTEYERVLAGYGTSYPTGGTRQLLFNRTDLTGDRATVHLTVEEFHADGLRSSTFRYDRSIRLVREDREWRIDEPLMGLDPGPFPYFD